MGKKIAIEQLSPGMVLEETVKELYGRILMSKGDVLTEKSIRILKMWGIVEVEIVQQEETDTDQPAPIQLDPVMMEEASKEAENLFRYTDTSGLFAGELLRLSTLTIVRRKMKECYGEKIG